MKKIKCKVTREQVEDFKFFNSSIDAEAELTRLLSESIQNDINAQLLPISMRLAARTVGLDLVSVKPSTVMIDDINGYFYSGNPVSNSSIKKKIEPKGQRISDVDPYGEENWDI